MHFLYYIGFRYACLNCSGERGLLPKISIIMDLLDKTVVMQSNPPDELEPNPSPSVGHLQEYRRIFSPKNTYIRSSFCIFEYVSVICTSSAAQGGGGSFKNRKPIGEVGCCESGMAERRH